MLAAVWLTVVMPLVIYNVQVETVDVEQELSAVVYLLRVGVRENVN